LRSGYTTSDGSVNVRTRDCWERGVCGASFEEVRERERVAVIPQCAECGKVWLPAGGERWEAYLTDDERRKLAFYCPECAERGFGFSRNA
jgi:hypothetical protein